MTQMTNVELFNKVLEGIRAQGGLSYEVSVSYGIACRYRAVKDGKTYRCAAGQLIPDENYTSDLEGKASYDKAVLAAMGIDSTQSALVRHLQEIHDSCAMEQEDSRLSDTEAMRLWEENMKDYAEAHLGVK